MNCGACGNELLPSARFCNECGARVPRSAVARFQTRHAAAHWLLTPIGALSVVVWLAVMAVPYFGYTPGDDAAFGLVFTMVCFTLALALPVGLWLREAAQSEGDQP